MKLREPLGGKRLSEEGDLGSAASAETEREHLNPNLTCRFI